MRQYGVSYNENAAFNNKQVINVFSVCEELVRTKNQRKWFKRWFFVFANFYLHFMDSTISGKCVCMRLFTKLLKTEYVRFVDVGSSRSCCDTFQLKIN